ncbi:blt801 protein [Hibiscus syriacus]|uniref:Blt801 protein n=1 Tax=Hibiscus syriacus TaxID=106335 RepID=A0A6A3AZ71_HIBSY|nr:blt801 protein [Hibiscus syriacus]
MAAMILSSWRDPRGVSPKSVDPRGQIIFEYEVEFPGVSFVRVPSLLEFPSETVERVSKESSGRRLYLRSGQRNGRTGRGVVQPGASRELRVAALSLGSEIKNRVMQLMRSQEYRYSWASIDTFSMFWAKRCFRGQVSKSSSWEAVDKPRSRPVQCRSDATDDRALEEAFSVYGEIVESKIINDRETGRSRGFGFVTFRDEKSMRDAIEGMNGQNLDGRNITVNEAQSRGGGGRGGGYNLSGSGGGYGRRDGDGVYGGGRREGGYGMEGIWWWTSRRWIWRLWSSYSRGGRLMTTGGLRL